MSVGQPPLFSVVTPVFRPPVEVLRTTIESVRNQSWADWELLLVDDYSDDDVVRGVLRDAAAADHRIRVIERSSNGGIVAASNDAIAAAHGKFFALLDHDDLLLVDALATMARAIEHCPDVDYLYSDEQKVGADGALGEMLRKPDWSPERLRHSMYTCHLSVLRAALVREVGGFHEGFDGSQDHDLTLRVTERARQVIHVPKVLYHWRIVPGSTAIQVAEKPYAWDAGRRAVQAHLDRIGSAAIAELGPHPGVYRVRRRISTSPRVSLVVPTHGNRGMVWDEPRCFVVEAVRSALAKTGLSDVEVVVVYGPGTPTDTLCELRQTCGDRLVLLPYHGAANFSAQCNYGFLAASGDVVVLLHDDVQVETDGWLEELVAPLLQEPDLGMTGAQLRLADGRIQHAGFMSQDGGWAHAYLGAQFSVDRDLAAMSVNREVSGVSAACAAIRREVFEDVGGMCELLPTDYSDIDLSIKLRSAGFRVVCIANSVLYHFESRPSNAARPWGVDQLARRWGVPGRDPYTRTA